MYHVTWVPAGIGTATRFVCPWAGGPWGAGSMGTAASIVVGAWAGIRVVGWVSPSMSIATCVGTEIVMRVSCSAIDRIAMSAVADVGGKTPVVELVAPPGGAEWLNLRLCPFKHRPDFHE